MPSPASPRSSQRFLAPLRQWDGLLPTLMSIVVLVMIIAERLHQGMHAPHHDEGTADHVAIMLMYGQIPIMLWFVAARRHPVRTIAPTLAIQLGLWAATFIAAVMLT